MEAPHELLGTLLSVQLPGSADGAAPGRGGGTVGPAPAQLRQLLLQIHQGQRAQPRLRVGEGAGTVRTHLTHGGL